MEVQRLMARVFTISISTYVFEAAKNYQIITRINTKTCHGTEEIKRTQIFESMEVRKLMARVFTILSPT
ncbi:hypothetical protein E2C01_047860 [Portunus trituberculatus]|uniref:Uncharacterized protein n=1 Tax=Portunus trituberculatus TaxID=210409 RepID=A0A5B7G903_PORTR|nr:hypothetical protein [Portunus trituberculatus]